MAIRGTWRNFVADVYADLAGISTYNMEGGRCTVLTPTPTDYVFSDGTWSPVSSGGGGTVSTGSDAIINLGRRTEGNEVFDLGRRV